MAITDLIDSDRFVSSAIRDLLVHARDPKIISLAGGLPADSVLPTERANVAFDKLLTSAGASALQYGLTAGEPALREQLASLTPNGLSHPDRIVVTAGSQQALDLTIKVLRSPDPKANIAVVENPGYLGAIQALKSHDYTLAPIAVDADGLDVDQLEQELTRGLRPRLCYINPTFQNPTGATLSTERGSRLIRLAEQYNFVVLADDPYVELYLDGSRPEALPQSEMVAYLGSFSKTLAPGLRVGWLDANPALASAVALAKQPADLQTSTINQLLVSELISDQSWWQGHLQALRQEYTLRRSALLKAVDDYLPTATVSPQSGGFFLWATLASDQTGDPTETQIRPGALLDSALRHGMAFVPGHAFIVGAAQPRSLRLSYSNSDPAQFGEAIRRLNKAVNQTPQADPGETVPLRDHQAQD